MKYYNKSFFKKGKDGSKYRCELCLYKPTEEFAKLFDISLCFDDKKCKIGFAFLFFSFIISFPRKIWSHKDIDGLYIDNRFTIYYDHISITIWENEEEFDWSDEGLPKRRIYHWHFLDYLFGERKKLNVIKISNESLVVPTKNGTVISNVEICTMILKRKHWFGTKYYQYNIEILFPNMETRTIYHPKKYMMTNNELKNYIYNDSLQNYKRVPYFCINIKNIMYVIVDTYIDFDDETKSNYLIEYCNIGDYINQYRYINKIEFDRMCKLQQIEELI